jgi:4-hydroxy-tetrahydrodipicolinate synthase
MGTTGEGPSLSYRLRREMIDRVCAYANGRLPVLVGVADTSLTESLRLAEHAAGKGATAVVATCPFYFPLSQGDYLCFLERTSSQFPLPLFLYNLPQHVGFSIAPETVRAAALLPNIWGFKDSSGDLAYLGKVIDLLRDRPEFTILNGPEELLADAVALGAHGGVCGGTNLYPELYVRLYIAARDRNEAEAHDLQERVRHICDILTSGGGGSYLRGLKCALGLAGICSDVPAEPLSACSDAIRETIRRELARVIPPVP